jgi:hypothetical protein
VTDYWFWSTPEWSAYKAAYGPTHPEHNFGELGNLVVPLGPQKEMWSQVRKGHQATIRKTERSVTVSNSVNHFAAYQALHEKDAGRKTRPQATFDLMRSFIHCGCGMLYSAFLDGALVGSAYFYVHQRGAYYGSAARDPDLDSHVGVAHLLVWRAMVDLSARSGWLDMGPIPDPDGDPKLLSIAHFKRGFGAKPMVWPYP